MTNRFSATTINLSKGQTRTRQMYLKVFMCFYLAAHFSGILGQVKIEVTKPSVKLVNDSLIISYGFTRSTPKDIFNVRLEITDSTGKVFQAKSIKGDIGDSINGGLHKVIVWNMAADNIYINQNIYIEVIGEKLEPPVQAFVQPLPHDTVPETVAQQLHHDTIPETVAEKNVKKKTEASSVPKEKEASETIKVHNINNILLSAVVPGWGLTRLSDGKPYWLIGVAGFGCIASSIYFNRLAVSSYDDYKNSLDIEKSNSYFSSAENQYLISNICAYTAIGIWVIDLGVVTYCTFQVRKSKPGKSLSYFSIRSDYQAGTNTPLITLNYRF